MKRTGVNKKVTWTWVLLRFNYFFKFTLLSNCYS